ncbi:MAG TPA: hypothetical protein VGN61_12700 [Verrucomicrobiae bacterium]|jgi:hypothetical protein
MNSEFDNQLEAETDRLLEDLPDLAAPPDLISRTLNRIEEPVLSWPSRPWFAWPAGIRIAYVVFALAALTAVMFGWRALEPKLFGAAPARFAQWTSGAACFWNALGVLRGAFVLVIDHLGRGFVVSCILTMVTAYAICVAFGTAFVRLTLGGPRKNHL